VENGRVIEYTRVEWTNYTYFFVLDIKFKDGRNPGPSKLPTRFPRARLGPRPQMDLIELPDKTQLRRPRPLHANPHPPLHLPRITPNNLLRRLPPPRILLLPRPRPHRPPGPHQIPHILACLRPQRSHLACHVGPPPRAFLGIRSAIADHLAFESELRGSAQVVRGSCAAVYGQV
jgi:hypothetical protein